MPDPGSGTDLSNLPLRGVSSTLREQFARGDALFERTQRDADGLGPLYVRAACVDCHRDDVRGPGLVEKISITEADGVTAAADQSKLLYGHSVRPYVTAGASTPVLSPLDIPGVKISRRLGPPVIGRGYMEAVLDSEIERLESEQAARTDEIHGRVHRVTYTSEKNPESEHGYSRGETGLIGRFGLKARIATLDDFTADAFQGDMGITSPMRPLELLNPDGLTDDDKPGVDTTLDDVNDIA
ncbi:MAG: di-heme oxidoredictase family protein, partial [Byssovorax sp.]